ncbi:IS21 family transposase [Herbaspirillum lusitanum]|uniref:IS21 family transposase n=1 Tax=Herbaspirillum lusitanum TaxID=213312 RepID=UPI0002D3FDDB|nr:IS21 family transposase [Herbaspirillum lusitanum]
MIDVALLGIIRRWHLRDQISLREIAKRLGISRNTVRRYLRSETVEPAYADRRSASALDVYTFKLSAWLKTESTKSRKQKRSLKQMHADLCVLGFEGSYDRVAAFARQWKVDQLDRVNAASKGTYIPLSFDAGEAFQFDWSEDWVVIAGERTKLQIAHFKLSHSRAFYLKAYPIQTHEMLFDAHEHAFRVFGGIPRRGIYDNMKTAVDKVKTGKQRDVNARFSAMVSHYLFDAEFCNPASGWEKGQIEKNVRDSRHRIWHTVPDFPSLEALNLWLENECLSFWKKIRHPEAEMTIWDAWGFEKPHLLQMGQPFDGFVEHTKRVSPTCLVTHERNRYSVPASFANRPISLRVYARHLSFVAEGKTIAEHVRYFNKDKGPGQTIFNWRHYLAVLQRKPGALRNGTPFKELPNAFKQLQGILLKRPSGDREMVEILALVLFHNENIVLKAVELSLESGAPSKQSILNILSRLLNGKPAPRIDAPQALALAVEPMADVGRYDQLRKRGDENAA